MPSSTRSKLLFLISLIGILYCAGCDDDDGICNDPANVVCPNFDACIGQALLSADFDMVDSVSTRYGTARCEAGHVIMETDTVRGDQFYFVARHPKIFAGEVTYEWQIGDDPEPRYGKAIVLRFNRFGPGSVEVTLRVSLSSGRCPDLDGSSFVKSKTFQFTEQYDSELESGSKVYGKYLGGYVGNTETRVIEIKNYLTWDGLSDGDIITNLFDGCNDRDYAHPTRMNYRHFNFLYTGSTCKNICGSGKLSNDDQTLTMTFTKESDGNAELHTWVGRRIE